MFEVINGGKDPSTPTPADMKSKLRQLTFLDHLRIRRQHATFGPRFALAVLFGPAVCLSVILILFLAESNGLLIWSEIKSGAVRRGLYLSPYRSEEHTSELQSRQYLVCRLLLEK